MHHHLGIFTDWRALDETMSFVSCVKVAELAFGASPPSISTATICRSIAEEFHVVKKFARENCCVREYQVAVNGPWLIEGDIPKSGLPPDSFSFVDQRIRPLFLTEPIGEPQALFSFWRLVIEYCSPTEASLLVPSNLDLLLESLIDALELDEILDDDEWEEFSMLHKFSERLF